MRPLSQQEVAQAVAGVWPGEAPLSEATPITQVTHNSREVGSGSLFVALRGERHDGHTFVHAAAAAGAALSLVDAAGAQAQGLRAQGVPHLVVADTERALGDLAAAVRRAIHRPVAAITGSNGKTTTKELLAAALSPAGLVHRTAGNLNNLIGLPQTVFGWPEAAWAAVLEMGMNAPGEIARLTQIAAPQVGIITCVAAAHLQGLGTLANVAKAKVELLEGLPKDATAIVNGDDEPLMAAAAPHLAGRRVLTFGRAPSSDVRLLQVDHAPGPTGELGLALRVEMGGEVLAGHLPLVGLHNGMNAAGALCAAWVLGIDAAAAIKAMSGVHVPGSRGRVRQVASPAVWLLDDCYNANPQSMAAALATLVDLADGARCLAVLGDMRELGDEAELSHAQLGRAAVTAGVTGVVAVGAFAQITAAAVRRAGGEAVVADHAAAALIALRPMLMPGDWCLVKGSRGVRLEGVVEGLIPNAGPASH